MSKNDDINLTWRKGTIKVRFLDDGEEMTFKYYKKEAI